MLENKTSLYSKQYCSKARFFLEKRFYTWQDFYCAILPAILLNDLARYGREGNFLLCEPKFPLYLHIAWIGNVSMKFEKQIMSAVKHCFFSVETRVIFNTRQLLPAIRKDVLPSHHHSNVIYQFVCHCDSRYVSRTSQRLEERIIQHVPRSIVNPPASPNRQSLSRSCKANTRPQQFYESAIGQHLLDNAQRALHYNNEKFSILARGRSSFHLSDLEAIFIKSLKPLLCKQKEFVYSLKIF